MPPRANSVAFTKSDWLFAFALIAATFLAYQPAWNGLPIWDDGDHITHVDLRSLHGLVRIWTELGAAPQYYPVLHTVFWIEHKLWGDFPLGYHLVNIFLHAGSALLLVNILRRLNVPGAWLAAAIFALHPLHVESVAWISELKNTLSGTFCLLAALAYLRFDQDRQSRSYIFAFIFFALGVMTKSVIAPLPAALLVIFWCQRGALSWKRDAKPLLPFFVVGIAYGLLTAWIERKICNAEGRLFDFSFLDRFLIAGRAFWFYLAKLFWPIDLVVIYPRWHVPQSGSWQYFFAIAVLAFFIFLWAIRRRSRAPLAGVLIFAAMIFPMIGLLNIAYFAFSFVADHFDYLASIGIITLAAAGMARISSSKFGPHNRIVIGLSLALLALLGTLTWRHSHVFRDGETCYRAILAKNPDSPTAHSNLGGILADEGRWDEAIDQYHAALSIQPDYEFGHFNLGAALLQKGLAAEAIQQFEKVLEINPKNAKAYYSLGNIAEQRGNADLAVACYESALKANPRFADAYGNLGNIFLEKGNAGAAIAQYRKVIELDPESAIAHYNLAAAFLSQKQWDEAIAHLHTALQIDPNYPDAQSLLNQAQSERGQR